MTDTDKLKRLADAKCRAESAKHFGCEYVGFDPGAILALVAENERLSGALKAANDGFEKHERLWYLAKDERDEAVALLRDFTASGDKRAEMWGAVFAFLARIDAWE